MKSTLFTLLPLAGFAFAEPSCDVYVGTVTITEYEYEPMTVPSVTAQEQTTPAALASSSSSCSRLTFTTTTTELVTITVEASSNAPQTLDVTSTSTMYTETIITISPSGSSPAASVLPSSMTSSSCTSAIFHPSSTAAATPTSTLPDFSILGSSSATTATPTSKFPDISTIASSSAATSTVIPTSSFAAVPSSASPTATQGSGTSGSTNSGQATFYGGNTSGGMCSFTGYTIPSGIFGTALSDTNWDNANACGQCVSVTGPDGQTKITAMVVDQCPGCGANHLDLFPDAFKTLADPSKGIINVSWQFVPCGISSALVLKNKSGTSKFWFSMQVVNANVKVTKLEVSTDGGSSWKPTTRQPYNFFENSSGFGTDTVAIRVTGGNGNTVVVNNVGVASGSTFTAGGNL
ncbi:hypothetical protein ACEQ8H_002969 [Pleosporales sp. CAS-2024a]